MEMLGHVVIAWSWLKQALVAEQQLRDSNADNDFYQAKLNACQFFYRWELPKIQRQSELLSSLDDTLLNVSSAAL